MTITAASTVQDVEEVLDRLEAEGRRAQRMIDAGRAAGMRVLSPGDGPA